MWILILQDKRYFVLDEDIESWVNIIWNNNYDTKSDICFLFDTSTYLSVDWKVALLTSKHKVISHSHLENSLHA